MLRRKASVALLVGLTLTASSCARSDSYKAGFGDGERLGTLGITDGAACKLAFIASDATDREDYLAGCQAGQES